jgi:dTDP-glucose pyrophosphorylase
MDEVEAKLLIIIDDEKFNGLISIGDIQRAIIHNVTLTTSVADVIRKDFYYASVTDNPEKVKQQMILHRDECMPIVDQNRNIVDVIFWDDIFPKDVKRNESKLDVPVVIMAGGLGTRLKPLTNVIPKPMVPIGEHTISEEIIHRFKELGATKFFMSLNYKAELVKFYFNEKKDNSYNLEYFEEDKPLGTAGSLNLLKDKIKSTFFVSNCDVIIDQDYRDILDFHRSNGNQITMVCSLKTIYIPYGTVITGEEGQLLSMHEKPEFNFMVNTGMYILEPSLLLQIPDDRLFHITELINQVLERKGRVGVFPISTKQYDDIGDWECYLKTIKAY